MDASSTSNGNAPFRRVSTLKRAHALHDARGAAAEHDGQNGGEAYAADRSCVPAVSALPSGRESA
eukprot:scaffold13_cov241-Pinguiococcus_pyrenoidosus.AAC.40